MRAGLRPAPYQAPSDYSFTGTVVISSRLPALKSSRASLTFPDAPVKIFTPASSRIFAAFLPMYPVRTTWIFSPATKFPVAVPLDTQGAWELVLSTALIC